MDGPKRITCSAPVNMAVIKYWGKRDEPLNLPLNSSLSATLSQDDLKTVTSVEANSHFQEDEIWLNGKLENIQNPRVQKCLRELRNRATVSWANWKVKIVSINNFPTAAGLASSASGYCCLVFALAKLWGVEGDVSTIARLGSGSACRSLFGGWVKWEVGTKQDGTDSRAIQVATEDHWKEMRILVCVVNDQKKETSSTDGMQQSVKTSKLLAKRAAEIVPVRMPQMEKAIAEKDYPTFANLAMIDSDDFHAVCADTQPPIHYLNDTSKAIIQLVHAYNASSQTKASYTFDAGPNACIFLEEKNVVPMLALLLHYFPPHQTPADKFFKDQELLKASHHFVASDILKEKVQFAPKPDALKYILYTRVGDGPRVLPESESLLTQQKL